MNPTGPAALVPPRPNLGPEPAPSARPIGIESLVPAFALVLAAVVLGWARRRHRARPSPPLAATPAGWSETIRAALATRFGPAWRAKTTEEIAADPDLSAALGPDQVEWLLNFLHAADRARFGGETLTAEWGTRVAALVARIKTPA